MPAPTPTYAEVTDYKDWDPTFVVVNVIDLEAILVQAERDIDMIFVEYPMQSNGLKFGDPHGANETGLSSDDIQRLTRATCAQAAYRMEMGPEFFVLPQYESVQGPDFSTKGFAPYIAPAVARELSGSTVLSNLSMTSIHI